MRLGETLVKAIAMLCRCLTRGRDIINTKMKWAVVVLALATVVVLGVLMVQRAAFSTELNSDFITYRAAGWAVLTAVTFTKCKTPAAGLMFTRRGMALACAALLKAFPLMGT